MSDNNEQFKWLKPFLTILIFSLLSCVVYADNITESADYGYEDFLLIEPEPLIYPECGVNEVYQSCEIDCIDCENRGMCEPYNCSISHCDCKMYFVHVTPGGPCEHISVCPFPKCPENEVYRHCGPNCEDCDMSPCRTLDCSYRCFCKQGYRRNRETGKCVPENECPERLTCISNDLLSKTGPLNDHCMQTDSEALRGNETIEEEKCYCAKGFKRNMHGWCIQEEFCPYVTCSIDTEFQDCPRNCNTTCWNYGDPNCKEDGQCYPGCFCPEGYVLNEFFACIPFEMCPPGSNPFVPTLPPPTIAPIPEPTVEESGNASTVAATEASESSATTESSLKATTESTTDSKSSSDAAEVSENPKESEPEETTPEETTTVAPKKQHKKVLRGGKIYKSAARPGKTVAPPSDDSSSSKSSSAAEEEKE